jgi:hypothetical protein
MIRDGQGIFRGSLIKLSRDWADVEPSGKKSLKAATRAHVDVGRVWCYDATGYLAILWDLIPGLSRLTQIINRGELGEPR